MNTYLYHSIITLMWLYTPIINVAYKYLHFMALVLPSFNAILGSKHNKVFFLILDSIHKTASIPAFWNILLCPYELNHYQEGFFMALGKKLCARGSFSWIWNWGYRSPASTLNFLHIIGQRVPLLLIKKPHVLIFGSPEHSRRRTWILSLSGFRQRSRLERSSWKSDFRESQKYSLL